MKIQNAVICAAGLGSRLGLDTPKCLVKIGEHKIIYYLLKLLKDVPNVRVVVGFKEEEVIDYVKKIRPDVVFVRNPNYQSTTNSYSLYLGSHDFNEPFLNIDGDMIVSEDAYLAFVDKINPSEDLIGINTAYTQDAVFTKIDEQGNVIEFSREKISNYEWTGIAFFSTIKISKEGKYVYQELEKKLPIKSCFIDCFEVDTPQDLDYAYKKINFI